MRLREPKFPSHCGYAGSTLQKDVTSDPIARRDNGRRACGTVLRALVVGIGLALSASPVVALIGDCGQPVSFGVEPTPSDALAVLNVSVGVGSCEHCVCDVDDSGQIMATDALIVLRAAVRLPTTLHCPFCAGTTTSSTSTSSSTTTTVVIPALSWETPELEGPEEPARPESAATAGTDEPP
jgi:hypothetical protein